MGRSGVPPLAASRTATAAIASLGYTGRQGEHLLAVENTPDVHNMVVCTLCSCYPWPVLGLPPVWYKSAPYRSRAVTDPRGVLRDFGVELPADTEIRVWDSTAELRYLVVPMRPAGTDGWSEDELAELVTRDSMIGTGLADPGEAARERRPRHGRRTRVRPGRARAGRAGLPRRLGAARVRASTLAMGATATWNLDAARFARETHRRPRGTWRAPTTRSGSRRSSASSPSTGSSRADEVAAGRSLRDPAPHRAHPAADDVLATLGRGGPPRATPPRPARFAVGDRVRARNINPPTHTRLPRYVRGHVGTVELVHAPPRLPGHPRPRARRGSAVALHGRFDARELWGADADPTVRVSVDAFEPYLEPVA